MIAVPESLPDDPILLKHLLLLASEQAAAKDARIEQLRISEHRDRPFRLIVTAHFANA